MKSEPAGAGQAQEGPVSRQAVDDKAEALNASAAQAHAQATLGKDCCGNCWLLTRRHQVSSRWLPRWLRAAA